MNQKRGLSSSALHIIAMFSMLCDHLWATVFLGLPWLHFIGRLAFPLYAFLLVEGYFKTKNLKRYAVRLFLFALLSEIPFNYVFAGSIFYSHSQNTIWTLLLGLCLISLNEKVGKNQKTALMALTALFTIFFGYWLGNATYVDYGGGGILTILTFYFFWGNGWKSGVIRFLFLACIHIGLLGGLYYPIIAFGYQIPLHLQGSALFALLPIALYDGRKGISATWFRYLNYAFYPCHLALLSLLILLS